MALGTKLGVALFIALASNVTLLSTLLFRTGPNPHTTTEAENDHKDNARHSDLEDYRAGGQSGRGKVNFLDISHSAPAELVNRPEGVSEQRRSHQGKQVPERFERSTLKRVDTGHHLDDVIASLTEEEVKELPENVAKILVPALIGLESLVLRELERLHDVSVHQELRLEKMEKRALQEKEVLEAANVIREERFILERKAQKKALQKELDPNSVHEKAAPPSPSGNQPRVPTAAEVLDFEQQALNDSLDDGSGSGEGASSSAVEAVVAGEAVPAAANSSYTDSSDTAIINHIYEIYGSLTSMEHKVMELGSSLSTVSSELYRQRSTFVRMGDKVQEIRRNQRNLVMRSTMHGFKLSDLEQFKGQAEMMLRTAEGTIEQFEAKLEIFKDRVLEQQDEMQTIRSTFGRLEQTSSELRTSDSYKAHDIQELKRGAQQLEGRLTSLYHSLDQYVGNIRWDVKTYLDHLCANNNLQC